MDTQTLTTAQVTRALHVTNMTLHEWRRGSAQRPPLPVAYRRQGKAHRVLIYAVDIQKWLAKYRPDLLTKLDPIVGTARSL